MRIPPPARRYDLAAAALSAGLAGFELVRIVIIAVQHRPGPGHTPLSLVIGGAGFCLVLAFAAVGLVLHRRIGWIAGALGVLAALSHGVVLRAGGSLLGVVYMFASFALLALVVKSLHFYQAGAIVSA